MAKSRILQKPGALTLCGDLKEQFGQLKNQQEELKVQVDQALADIWDLKMQINEM